MKLLKKSFFASGVVLISGMVLAACGGQEVAESLPTATHTATMQPPPTDTAVPTHTPTATQTTTPSPSATPEEVQAFYEAEMSQLGWSMLGAGAGDTGAVLMIFQKGAEIASISILTVNPTTTYVFMVK